jgi:hypothetical protein
MSWLEPKSCYVLMPFSSTRSHTETEWTETFEKFFKPTLESLGYSCERSVASVGSVLGGIIESIHRSWIILADLTDCNTNVMYELGVAHTMTNNTIIVSQDIGSVPSDLKSYGVILYDPKTKDGAMDFMKRVSAVLSELHSQNPKKASPIYEYLGLTHRRMEQLYHPALEPVAYLECSKCHVVYEIPLNGMSHGAGDTVNLCAHWEPAIFRGIKNIHLLHFEE